MIFHFINKINGTSPYFASTVREEGKKEQSYLKLKKNLHSSKLMARKPVDSLCSFITKGTVKKVSFYQNQCIIIIYKFTFDSSHLKSLPDVEIYTNKMLKVLNLL